MGRKRSFDETTVLDALIGVFLDHGYEGTSLDELVAATGLLRGSLYSAFGSKRGMFLAALRHATDNDQVSQRTLDLMLVALLELAPRDEEVRTIVSGALVGDDQHETATRLGRRLLERAGLVHPSYHQR